MVRTVLKQEVFSEEGGCRENRFRRTAGFCSGRLESGRRRLFSGCGIPGGPFRGNMEGNAESGHVGVLRIF